MFETDLQPSSSPTAGDTRGGINGKYWVGNIACGLDCVVHLGGLALLLPS
jgi:hypothetical protein